MTVEHLPPLPTEREARIAALRRIFRFGKTAFVRRKAWIELRRIKADPMGPVTP